MHCDAKEEIKFTSFPEKGNFILIMLFIQSIKHFSETICITSNELCLIVSVLKWSNKARLFCDH